MARVRGMKHNKYKDDGTLTERRYGRVVFDTEPPGLSQPYAPQEFSTADVDDAIAKYGQWGQDNYKGYGVWVKKILGAGRFGIVALVDYINEKGDATPCVLKLEKYRHHVHGTLAREEKALTKFKGAKHILQLLDITQLAKSERSGDYDLYAAGQVGQQPGLEPDDEERDQQWNLENFAHQPVRNFIFVEHSAQGDLNMWLSKASRSGLRWPARAIWMLFKSLVQGLIGMGYPPTEGFGGLDRPEWNPNYPMSEHYQPQWTTHFDLEPSNILASSSMENGNMPVFKIADFGSVQFFGEYAGNQAYFDKELFWKCRFSGKGNYFTPEQFTRQWDHLDLQTYLADDNAPNPFVAADGTRPPVAGNYGMHSNVFQVGVIIWCAITLCAFKPLTATNYRIPNDREIVTWGGALQNERFYNVDEALKALVQRCMAEDPENRPSLGLLMHTIEGRLGANDLESEEAVAYWARDFFSSPRTPGDDRYKRRFSDDGDGDDEDARRHAPRPRTEAEPMIHSAFQEPRYAINLLNQPVNFHCGVLDLQSDSGADQGLGFLNDIPGVDPRVFQMPQMPEQWQGIPAFGAQPNIFDLGGQQMQQDVGAATFQPGGYFNVNAQFGENPFQPPVQQQQQQQEYMPPLDQNFQQIQAQHSQLRQVQPQQQKQQQQQPGEVPRDQPQPNDRPWWY
ncbi:serine threonine protein kinase, partial [Colletotrichum tofieldiae]